jgi:hypothetical protein
LDAGLLEPIKDPALADDIQWLRLHVHLLRVFTAETAEKLARGDSIADAVKFALRGDLRPKSGLLN